MKNTPYGTDSKCWQEVFSATVLFVKEQAMRFVVQASVGNADGVFDAAYNFGAPAGEEAQLRGTSEEIGAEVARFLSMLTPEDCKTMKYGTRRFFVELIITPEDSFGGE